MATERLRTIKPSGQGGDYTSVAAWDAGEQANLPSLDEIRIGEIQGDWSGGADTTTVFLDGWTTDSTRYPVIRTDAANRATAQGWDATRYRLSVTANYGIRTAGLQYLRVDGLQIEVIDAGSAGNTCITGTMASGGSEYRLSNLRCRIDANSGVTCNILGLSDNDGSYKIWNSILTAHPNNLGTVDGLYVGAPSAGASVVHNCIIAGVRRGIRDGSSAARVQVYDTAVFNTSSVDFYGNEAGFNAIDHCASDENIGTNNVAESGGGAWWPDDFEDAANGDFRLKSTSNLVDAGGGAGSSLFSDDIEGNTRSGSWDIGASEYTSGASPQTVLPGSIGSDEAVGSPVLAPGAVALVPSGIVSGEGLGAPGLTPGAVSIAPEAIDTAEASGGPTISVGGATIAPDGIASGEASGTHAVAPGAVAIAPSGVAGGEAFGDPVVSAGGSTLVPPSIPGGEVFADPIISVGPVTIVPGGLASGEVFGGPDVAPGPVAIQASSIASGESFGAATLSIGPITITPAGIAGAEAFGTAEVVLDLLFVVPGGIPPGEAFGQAVVGGGTVTIAPPWLVVDRRAGLVSARRANAALLHAPASAVLLDN